MSERSSPLDGEVGFFQYAVLMSEHVNVSYYVLLLLVCARVTMESKFVCPAVACCDNCYSLPHRSTYADRELMSHGKYHFTMYGLVVFSLHSCLFSKYHDLSSLSPHRCIHTFSISRILYLFFSIR